MHFITLIFTVQESTLQQATAAKVDQRVPGEKTTGRVDNTYINAARDSLVSGVNGSNLLFICVH